MSGFEYEEFAANYLNVLSVSGKEAMAICIFHEDSNASMQFNLETGLYLCFSCGAKGNIRTLENRFGISHRDPGVGIDTIYRRLAELKKIDRDEGPRILPESELKKYALPTKHWAARGFNATTITSFDLGYDVHRDALTIPIRTMGGELLGFQRRFMDPDATPRYMYPKGFHKKEHLFASWMVANDSSAHTVALTEGAIDTMTLWQYGVPAMAIYGSSISPEQIRVLRMLGIDEIVLFFDNDKAGKELTRRSLGWSKINGVRGWVKNPDEDLRRYFKVRTVDWKKAPRHTDHRIKDANDLDRLTAVRMFRTAKDETLAA